MSILLFFITYFWHKANGTKNKILDNILSKWKALKQWMFFQKHLKTFDQKIKLSKFLYYADWFRGSPTKQKYVGFLLYYEKDPTKIGKAVFKILEYWELRLGTHISYIIANRNNKISLEEK